MTTIQPQPFTLKDMLLQLGADNYELQISEATFNPTVNAQRWRAVGANKSYSDVDSAVWDLVLKLAQDHETAGSLSDFLYANEGTKQTASLKPKSGSGPSYQAVVTISPAGIGGAAAAWAEGTVTLPCDGKPTKIPAAPSIPIMSLSDPVSGPIAGGTLVSITGAKFTGATAVHFGTTPATSFKVLSDTLIAAVAPAQAAGSKPIKVTNASGQSTTTAAYAYV